jgi:hypothetical protein
LLLRAQNLLLLRKLRESRGNWGLPWSGGLIINLLSITVKSCVSSLSDIRGLDLEVSWDLEISRALTAIGTLRKWKFFRVHSMRLVDNWIYDTATTAWTGTWIIKEDYFCKWGTTES